MKKKEMKMERVQYIKEMRDAIKQGNIEVVNRLIKLDNDKINLVLPTGSWLNLAVLTQNKDLIDYFLKAGIDKDIKIPGTNGNALNDAAAVADTELIEYLLSCGIKISHACDESNPIYDAISGNKPDNVSYLLELEKEKVTEDEYKKLCAWIINEADLVRNESILKLMAAKKENNIQNSGSMISNIEKEMKAVIINAVEAVIKYYAKENIYIISIEVDSNFVFYFYVNTEEHYKKNIERYGENDKWLYRFCENEWYIYEETPKYFDNITQKFKKQEEIQVEYIYELIAKVIGSLQKENYFENKYKKHILVAINAYDTYNKDEIIQCFLEMNSEKDTADYIQNIDDFI